MRVPSTLHEVQTVKDNVKTDVKTGHF